MSLDQSSRAAGEPLPPPAERAPQTPRRRVPLHVKILLGLVVGAALGIAAHGYGSRPDVPESARQRVEWLASNVADPLGRVFLRLVFMVVLPLVFSALVLAVVELGDLRRLGRVGVDTLVLTLLLSSIAVGIGISLVNLVRPGERLAESKRDALAAQYASAAKTTVEQARRAKPLRDTLLDIIPENPLQEMAGALDGSSKGNGMLAVMFFALAFGVALAWVGPVGQTLIRVLEGLFAACMAVVSFAMLLAPYAVGCLVFAMTSRLGAEVLATLAWFVATVLAGLGLQLLVVYPLVLVLLGRRNPWTFFRGISEAMLTAFGTSSSNATLPTALRVAEESLRLPPAVSRFVLTVGATGNQNGTALYEGVVVLFLAQVFGVQLTLGQQVVVVLMAVLGGVGTAGVPGGSIPMIVVVLQTVGVPGESIAIILGIDRVLDMCRTVLNVTGDLALAACIARRESPAAA